MRQSITGLFRSRIFVTVVLAFLVVSHGGAAYEPECGYDPGPAFAARRHNEPIQGYSSHAEFKKECLHCHAPVRCLSANLCQDCHDQNSQEYAESEGLHGLLPGTNKCQTYDIVHQGRDNAACGVLFGSINHERLTGFCLNLHKVGFDGMPLTCESCHPDGQYDAVSVACAGCHAAEDPEYMGGRTERNDGNCTDCHDGQDSKTGFEHDEVYALNGTHKDAGCRDCHTGSSLTEAVLDCADCHEDPKVHAGEFGLHCDWCHSVTAWSPAQLTEHPFRLNHGGLDEATCETCHPEKHVTYTCYGCHDHQPAEMQELHAQQGIDQLEPCAECHPTGLEGEAGEAELGV